MNRTVQMIGATCVMAWDNGDEAGRSVGAGRLDAAESGILTSLGAASPAPFDLEITLVLNALQGISIMTNT